MNLPQVKDIISENNLFLRPDTKIADAMAQMQTLKVSCGVIIDGIEPVGIITERDAVGLLNESFNGTNWGEQPVSHVMTSPVSTIHWDLSVLDAVAVTKELNIRNVPVINEFGEAVAVINHSHLLLALYEYFLSADIY